MKTIDLFYQGQGIADIGHVEVLPDVTFGVASERISQTHGLPPTAWVFVEDEDEPVDRGTPIGKLSGQKGLKIHVHDCRIVHVTVTFNGKTLEHQFSPASTVSRVKAWAAEHIGMSREEASEHVLQISGTHDRPAPGTHIGVLTSGKVCSVSFDLLPDERVNGASGSLP
jgi:hypothetical protein